MPLTLTYLLNNYILIANRGEHFSYVNYTQTNIMMFFHKYTKNVHQMKTPLIAGIFESLF